MLRITGIHEAATGQLHVDEFVPFSFRISETVTPSPLLWRTGDFHNSLLELKIERHLSMVIGVTLTLFSGPVEFQAPFDISDVLTISGVPVVDTTAFHEDRTDERKAFRLIYSGTTCFALFDKSGIPDRCLRNGRLGVFETGQHLSGCGFFDLSPKELDCLVPQSRR